MANSILTQNLNSNENKYYYDFPGFVECNFLIQL